VSPFPDEEEGQEVWRISVIADVAERKPRGAKCHACPGSSGAAKLSGSERESKAPCRALSPLTSRQRVRERFQTTKSPKVNRWSEWRHLTLDGDQRSDPEGQNRPRTNERWSVRQGR